MRFLERVLFTCAMICLVGSFTALTAQEIPPGLEAGKQGAYSTARREVPGRLGKGSKAPHGLRKPWPTRERATGDWRAVRPWLDDHGITPEVTFTGEFFSNLRGGIDIKEVPRYRGNLDITLSLNTEALGWWPGGTFFFYLQNGHGSGLSEKIVGDIQTLSNIDADEFFQISEYWLEQSMFQDRVRTKFGKQDANVDFCALDYGSDFANSSFGVIPTVPLPTFPDPALGVAAFVSPEEWMTLGVGLFDGAANGGTSGFDTTFDGKGGTFGVVELALRTSVVDPAWKPGTYRAAFWYHTENLQEITGAQSPRTFSGNHGVYLAFDQLLLREADDPEDEQGIGAFAQMGWAPEDRNDLAWYVGGGLVYRGAFPNRDGDVLGVGVAHARFSDRVKHLDGLAHETALELFYKIQLTPWLELQPDLQFIANPGGEHDDAVAVGVRFAIDL